MKRGVLSKCTLALFGVLFALILIEASFRITGGLLSLGIEIRNKKALAAEGVYRILCLGESTTQGQWPPLLEEQLNRHSTGILFKVIDKGRGGVSSAEILAHLEKNLVVFKPHMVVVMMGINDGEWVWKTPLAYEDAPSLRRGLFFRNFRIYKLAVYCHDGLANRFFHKQKQEVASDSQSHPTAVPDRSSEAFFGGGYWAECVKKADSYREIGDFANAKSFYEKAISCDPGNPYPYDALGNLLWEKKDLDGAQAVFEKGIKALPRKSSLYIQLGRFYYLEKNDFDRAERMFKKAVELDPKNQWIFDWLKVVYQSSGKYEKAIEMYESAIKAHPRTLQAYVELSYFYIMKGEYQKARDLLSKANNLFGEMPKINGAQELLNLCQGNKPQVNNGSAKIAFPPMETVKNYQGLKERVLKRGIRLVCMQYPMRDVETLKQVLGPSPGVCFVENRENFERALKDQGLKELFTDMFAGDFGHCTYLGNSLIAVNLSKTILQEVLNIN